MSTVLIGTLNHTDRFENVTICWKEEAHTVVALNRVLPRLYKGDNVGEKA